MIFLDEVPRLASRKIKRKAVKEWVARDVSDEVKLEKANYIERTCFAHNMSRVLV